MENWRHGFHYTILSSCSNEGLRLTLELNCLDLVRATSSLVSLFKPLEKKKKKGLFGLSCYLKLLVIGHPLSIFKRENMDRLYHK